MKYVLLIGITLYVASKFGMDFEALFDASVNGIRHLDREISTIVANRGH